MKIMTRRLAPLGLAVLMVTGGTGVAMADSTYSPQACTIRVDRPNSNNNAITGRAGCSNTISGTGLIREDRLGPDDTVGQRTFSAGLASVNGSCGNGTGQYYSEFRSSSGASAQSSRATRC